MKRSETGWVWLTKKETVCLTRGFFDLALTASRLRSDQRVLLREFAEQWFEGRDLKFDERTDLGSKFLSLATARGLPLIYMRRQGRKGKEAPASFHDVLASHKKREFRYNHGAYWRCADPRKSHQRIRLMYLSDFLKAHDLHQSDLYPWLDTKLKTQIESATAPLVAKIAELESKLAGVALIQESQLKKKPLTMDRFRENLGLPTFKEQYGDYLPRFARSAES